MASGALLRRKVIIGSRNLGRHAESRGFRSLSHIHSHSLDMMDTKKNNTYLRNLLSQHMNAKPQVGFFMAPTSTLQSIRYTWTDRASKQDSDQDHVELVKYLTAMEQLSVDWPRLESTSKWLNYKYSIKLLVADLRVFLSLLARIFRGMSLSRKERRLLRHTTADIFRLLPGSVSIAVPLNNFLLPVYLKLFPNLLPTTFSYKINNKEELNREVKARLAYARFLHDVAREMDYPQSGGIRTAEDYNRFFLGGEPVTGEELLGFVKFFSDELTVDYVSRPQLVNMCKLMGITLCGNDDYMRLFLQESLKLLKVDDTLIQAKGIETLSEAELRKTCLKRGINLAEDMREQLRDWLRLSLDHSVPSSILILSRAFTMTGKSKPEKVILETLSSLPFELIQIVGVTLFPFKDPGMGKLMKLNSLCLQENLIKEEREKELLKKLQSDVALEETAERGRTMDKQELVSELSSHKLAVLASALIFLNKIVPDKSVDGTEKEDIKAYRAAREESIQDAELNTGDEVPSVLTNKLAKKVTAMFKNLDVDAKTVDGWRFSDRCDGKVSLEVVAAAACMKEESEKLGIEAQEDPKEFIFPSTKEEGSTLPMNMFLHYGMDFNHWFVVMEKPAEDMTRDQLIELYVDTVAKVVGSKEEAKMMIYSVSSRFYFAFGVKTSMEIADKFRELPGVERVVADSYHDIPTKSYGGEPFVDGKAVPYDRKYHEGWETREMRMKRAAEDLSKEVDTGAPDEVKPPWWLMPKIWYGRAYLRWIRHKNKE